MKIQTVTILYASEGMILTNGNAYGAIVSLGVGDSADNWHEIPLEEYAAIVDAEAEES
jgi:hypothetical protein